MEQQHRGNQKNILRNVFVYLGSAWVFIEALNFLIDKYYWNSQLLDILIILIIFGLPAMVIYLWFDGKFKRNAIILQALNAALTLSVITFSLVKPHSLNPNQIRLIKFQTSQKKLAQSVRSIAILPFSNYTGNENQASLVAGLQDALIGEFGQIGAMRVISRTSTLPYANSQKTIREIASELKVDAVIEASVLGADEGIRIQVKLINAVPEQQLWSKTFDTSLDNIMGLYGRIVEDIASQIQLALSPDENMLLQEAPRVDPEAYRAYLEGKYQAERLTETGFELALENFQRSIRLDSTYAPAHAGLAYAWIAALQMRYVSVTEAIPRIYENNLKALTLDANYPEAHYIQALMSHQTEWDWKKSETAFRMAIERDPNHALAHAFYSHVLMIQKRFDEAFAQLDKALELDPKNPLVLSLYAVVRWHHGDLKEALDLAQRSQEINPNNTLVYRIMDDVNYLQGDFEGSMAMLDKLYGNELEDFTTVTDAFARQGYPTAMLKLAELLQELSLKQSFYIALYYNRAGREQEALTWLERGYEFHDPDMSYAFLPRELDNLKSDPRYAALARKMNLPL